MNKKFIKSKSKTYLVRVLYTTMIFSTMLVSHIKAEEVTNIPKSIDLIRLQELNKSDIVNIPDVEFRKYINKCLGRNLDSTKEITKEDMSKIKDIYYYRGGIKDLTGIEYAINLETLEIYNSKVEKIGDLSDLKNLTKLKLDVNNISDISGIANCTSLKYLDLRKNCIDDITPIYKLVNLEYLNLEDNKHSSALDISALKNLSKLKEVNLNGNFIDNISSLKGLINLEKLYLSNNRVDSLEDLKSLVALKELYLDSNSISDISPIIGLINLEVFRVNYNQDRIDYIPDLSKLTKLRDLGLVNNNIKDISPLVNVPSLEYINLSANQIYDISYLSKLKNLKKANIGNQNININEDAVNGKVVVKNIIKNYKGKLNLNITPGRLEGDYIILENIADDLYININFNSTTSDPDISFYGGLYIKVSAGFKDINKHWANKEIEYFMDNKYINGYGDNTFRPNNYITRAEFVTIFNKVFRLQNSTGKVFDDTSQHWAKEDIDIATTNGVVNGISSTEFKPNDPITREQVAKMISNYKKLDDKNHNKIEDYSDKSQVSDWAIDSVEGIIEHGYMAGYSNGMFRPKENITRAEAVATLNRIINNN